MRPPETVAREIVDLHLGWDPALHPRTPGHHQGGGRFAKKFGSLLDVGGFSILKGNKISVGDQVHTYNGKKLVGVVTGKTPTELHVQHPETGVTKTFTHGTTFRVVKHGVHTSDPLAPVVNITQPLPKPSGTSATAAKSLKPGDIIVHPKTGERSRVKAIGLTQVVVERKNGTTKNLDVYQHGTTQQKVYAVDHDAKWSIPGTAGVTPKQAAKQGPKKGVESLLTPTGPADFKARMKGVFTTINKVHGHTLLVKPIPLKKTPPAVGSAAQFRYKFSGTATDILIRVAKGKEASRSSTLHEIGHMLDFGMGGGRFLTSRVASEQKQGKTPTSPAMAKLLDALHKSEAITYLRDTTEKSKHRSYLLDVREQFARSYAQYIATRAKDEKLMAQTQNKWKEYDSVLSANSKNFYPTTWRHSDFKEIAAAFDLLLKEMGWA